MGEGVDPKKGERRLGFLKFDFKKEDKSFLVWIVCVERGRDECEFRFEGRKGEFSLGMKRLGVEKEEEVEWTRGGKGEDAAKERIG